MYSTSVEIYDKLYGFKDYKKESDLLVGTIRSKMPSAHTLLDVACGTGMHLQYLKLTFDAGGIDLVPGFAAIAKKRNPELDIYVGDMRRFRLSKRFDVITCLFSAIGYMQTKKDLDRAMANMARHLTESGILIVEPWFVPAEWHAPTAHATFVDEPELKIARMSTSLKKDRLSIMEMHYLVCTPQQTKHSSEVHKMGLFTKEEMIDSFEKAGLETEYQEAGITGRGLYIGQSS
jgi:SAM-dependent methyltransferase